jgi:peptidoglycan/LPS O-acetylase OafA/YrhL
LLLCLACAARISDPLLRVGALAPLNCALVYGLAGQQGLVATFLGTPTLVLLGEASYATYLLHVPLQHWLRLAWEGMGLRVGASFILVFAVALVAVSLIAFKTIESPARRVIRLWLGRPARVSDPLKAPSA